MCNFASIKDFRGITISPVISKVFELCLVELFGEFLSSSSFQFGFKKGKGCRDIIYTLSETINYFVTNRSTVNIYVQLICRKLLTKSTISFCLLNWL